MPTLTFTRSILLVLALFTVAPVFAQAPGAGDFKSTYERGMTYFRARDFSKARAEFLAAYNLQSDPTVLFAIAQTYRFEGDFKEAAMWYRKFLGDSQAAQDLRTEAQTYLDEAEAKQKQADDARRKAAENGPKEADGRPATMPDGATSTVDAKPDEMDEPEVVRTRHIPLGSKIAAGVTGVGLITAIVVTKLGLDVEDDFSALREKNMATRADADRVERYQNAINISWGITAAAAVTTVALYFLAPTYTTDQRHIAIAPTTDGVSASILSRF